MSSDYDQLPLRERLTIADRMSRELLEHLEQGFLPKVESLRRVTRQKESTAADVTDKTVRNNAAQVLKSDAYTAELYAQLRGCLESIVSEVESMVHGD